MKEVGSRIKALRKKKKMTLKNIADETGYSISFLSQLERGKSSATLESLKKISLALGVNPGYFFENDEEETKVVKRSVLEKERMDSHNIFYQDLKGSMENPAFYPTLVVLKPNQNEGNLIQHPGQEFLFVLKGELTVQIEDDTYVLNPLDSMMFDSSKKHYWYNFSDEDVIFLCINYDEKLR